jgi:adenosylcobyric acid synthase
LGAHLDVDAVMELLERGAPRRPTITSGLSNLET